MDVICSTCLPAKAGSDYIKNMNNKTLENKKIATPTIRRKGGKKSAGKKPVVAKLRITMTAYEHKILDASIKQIMDIAFKFEAEVRGPVPLPINIKKYTVNRSSFIHKDAREQFEMRVHKRLVDIISPSHAVIEALTNLSLPAGVNIDVKLI